MSSPVIQPAVVKSAVYTGEPEGTHRTDPMVAAMGRRVTTGTVRRSRRGCEDGKSVPARTDTTKTKAGTTAKATRGKSTTAARGKTVPANGRGTKLVIVESPSKARTIAGYLGQDYVVESSVGHIRDMPDKAAEIPAKYRGEPWARLGVNVDHDFEPLYVVDPKKKAVVTDLRNKLKSADELLLATDEDREGEAIA